MRPIFRSIPQDSTQQARTPDGADRPNAILVLDELALSLVYGQSELDEIESMVSLLAPPQTPDSIPSMPAELAEAELLITGWGGPVLDEEFLRAAPRLKAVFYGGGAVSPVVTPAVWDRKIAVSSAYAANSVPVAEYAIATILFSLKHGWRLSRSIRENHRFRPPANTPGCYGSTVGLISMGMVARTLLKHLNLTDLRVLAYDPFLEPEEAEQLGVELVSLEKLFKESDVVSAHTPLFHETRGMITGKHFESMKPGATFINTARGQIVCEEEMLDVLESRPELQAVLDVCVEEPPAPNSRLYSLPNIVLTPHLAGSVGTECRRMGRFVVDELQRYLSHEPLHGLVTPKLAEHSSHRPERDRSRAQPISVV